MKYYVDINKENDGYHEVHTESCNRGPKSDNRIFLGEHKADRSAIKEAKRYFARSKECSHCSRRGHRRRLKKIINLSILGISKIINKNK